MINTVVSSNSELWGWEEATLGMDAGLSCACSGECSLLLPDEPGLGTWLWLIVWPRERITSHKEAAGLQSSKFTVSPNCLIIMFQATRLFQAAYSSPKEKLEMEVGRNCWLVPRDAISLPLTGLPSLFQDQFSTPASTSVFSFQSASHSLARGWQSVVSLQSYGSFLCTLLGPHTYPDWHTPLHMPGLHRSILTPTLGDASF